MHCQTLRTTFRILFKILQKQVSVRKRCHFQPKIIKIWCTPARNELKFLIKDKLDCQNPRSIGWIRKIRFYKLKYLFKKILRQIYFKKSLESKLFPKFRLKRFSGIFLGNFRTKFPLKTLLPINHPYIITLLKFLCQPVLKISVLYR